MSLTLTPQQDAFAQLVAAGKSQSDAYREAYPKAQGWTDSAVWTRSSRLYAKVLPRVEQIKSELAEQGLWTKTESVKLLREIALAGERDGDRIKAACELNKMHGYHEPEKHEHSGPGGAPLQVNYVSVGK